MPVTKSRNGLQDSLDSAGTTRFLFGEEDGPALPAAKDYLQMNTTDDKFPILVRREEFPDMVSW